jgi:serine O-acetyltransferase
VRVLVEALLFDNGFQAVVLHRLAHWCRSRRIPVLGPALGRITSLLTGAEISPRAEIGPGLMISHGRGLVVGGWSRIGANATLLHDVTVGGPSSERVREMPRLGDNVFVGAGARVIGGITVGDDVFIGVNAVVAQDIPAGARVLSAAGVTVKPRGDGDPGAR